MSTFIHILAALPAGILTLFAAFIAFFSETKYCADGIAMFAVAAIAWCATYIEPWQLSAVLWIGTVLLLAIYMTWHKEKSPLLWERNARRVVKALLLFFFGAIIVASNHKTSPVINIAVVIGFASMVLILMIDKMRQQKASPV